MHLRVRGSSLAKIAREMGVSKSTVTMVSQGRRRSRVIEQAIAGKLAISPAQLWTTVEPANLSEATRPCDCHSRGNPMT